MTAQIIDSAAAGRAREVDKGGFNYVLALALIYTGCFWVAAVEFYWFWFS